MIKLNERLEINNTILGDVSNKLADFTRGVVTTSIADGISELHIGFYKPIKCIYVDIEAPDNGGLEMSIKSHQSTSFVELEGVYDDTENLSRSGFIKWENSGLETKTTMFGKDVYWYSISAEPTFSSSTISIRAINIVFSDDQDLKREIFEISKYLPSGEKSHIMTHAAARDEIIQELNIRGFGKVVGESREDISAFDLLEISEVKLASTYLVLSKIMMSVSDQASDAYLQKSEIYRKMYSNIINSMKLTVDSNDDGRESAGERESITYGVVRRV